MAVGAAGQHGDGGTARSISLQVSTGRPAGFGPRRAGNYYRDQDEYVKLANDSVICVIQIEDVSAAEQIDEIVRVPEIDWIFVGIYDMSGRTEGFFDFNNPKLWKSIRNILDTAKTAGISIGNVLGGVDNIQKTLDLGCQLVVLGEDTIYLKVAADKALKVFREIIKGRK